MEKKNKTVSIKQARQIDKKASRILGVSTLVLMENAGRQLAEELISIAPGNPRVAIFCGKGNNAGDGFVAARHLLLRGIRPDIFLAAHIRDVKNEARTNLGILFKLKQKITRVNSRNLHLLKRKIMRYNVIIDALLGIGAVGEVRGVFKDVIELINRSKAKVIAVDIPSGLDADNGRLLGSCIKADSTVTFVAKKKGMVKGAGPHYCGRIVVKDLGIPL